MQDYEYKALNDAGAPKSGIIQAENLDTARQWVRDQKWFPVEVKEVKTHTRPVESVIKADADVFIAGQLPGIMTKVEIRALFESRETKQYMKFGEIAVREPFHNETLIVTCGGKVETVQKVKPDQYVVMALAVGSDAEVYAINKDIYEDKYEVSIVKDERDFACREEMFINGHKWYKARPIPKATIDAFKYSGPTFKFIAPWGAEMLCEDGDMLARTIGKENDIYRIEKDAFAVTYKEAE